jgi:hypothetical protein
VMFCYQSRSMPAVRYVPKLLGQFLKAWRATDCPPAIPQYRSIPSCNRLPSEDLMYCGRDLNGQANGPFETTNVRTYQTGSPSLHNVL